MSAADLLDTRQSMCGMLHTLETEILFWALEIAIPLREHDGLYAGFLRTVSKAVPVAVGLLANRDAAMREIQARAHKNNANRYFGLLLFAHKVGDLGLQTRA